LNLKAEDLKKYIISRDEFFRIRDKKEKTPEDNLKLLVNSFGNKCRTYLYGKDKADIKYNLAVEILENEKNWRQYKQTETYKNKIERLEQIERLQQLEQLGQLQQLQQLQQIERLARLQQVERLQQLSQLQQLKGLKQLELHNKSYKDFSHLENTIIYLDPPYENTTGYHGEIFEHKEFYNWAYEMSKKNIVLISSYEITDKRFECVYEFTTARSTMQSGITSDTSKIERLFMVKKD
jgi:phage protein